MQLHQFFCFMLSVVVLSTTAFAAPTAAEAKKAETIWSALLASLDSKRSVKSSTYNGARVLFRGVLADRRTGVSIPVRIPHYDAAKDQFVLLPVVCHVTLSKDDIDRIAEVLHADSVSVEVFGKVTHLDVATKTVEVQSESTHVAAAQ